MEAADTSAIEINSEDEAAETAPDDSLVHVSCRMLVPVIQTAESAEPPKKKNFTVGDVSISQRRYQRRTRAPDDSDAGATLTALELSLVSSKARTRSTIIPIKFISSMAVSDKGRTIALRLQEPVRCGFLAGSGQGVLLSDFALVPARDQVHAVITALRWWVPHVVVKGNIPARLSSAHDGFVLRFEGLMLTVRDIKLLEDEQCLNDSVIDFFLRLALDVIAPDHRKGELYMANTFFFQKLTSGGVENGEQGWNNVRRWTRLLPGGLLGQKYVVVPINEQNVHWWLAIICYAKRALDETESDTVGQMPRIVCLDSASDPPLKGRVIAFLRGYLWKEWCERHGGADSLADAAAWAHKLDKVSERLKVVEADVPKQTNSFDCGIFLIEYLLHLLQSNTALTGLGLAAHRHWFGQRSVSHRRKRLKWLAGLLQQEAKRKSQPDVAKLFEKDERLRVAAEKALTDKPKPATKDSKAAKALSASKRQLSQAEDASLRSTRQRMSAEPPAEDQTCP